MQSILDAINEWIKEILIGAINGNLSTMFGDVNEKVGTIANEVGQTPQGWNANIFSMIQTLSENVIVPIAGLVITYVLCYELISMVTEKNNMHDIETFMFFKWIFKAFVAVFIVTNTFNITMAVFDMAQHIVSGAAGVIGGDTNIDVAEALATMQEGLEDMEIPELLLLVLETSLVSLCMKIMWTDWKQLPKRAVRSWFSRLPHYDMCRYLRRTGKRYDNRRQSAQRGIFPCRLYGYPLFFPVQIRHTGKIHIQRPLRAERRFFLGVCTCTQRPFQSQNKSRFQSDKAANRLFCGGSLNRTAAVFFAQRQRRDKPCGYGDDCRHAPLFPACHV